jgi:DnaJ-class molecular chaperone
MASEETRESARSCMACRGTGKVISNLGGSASEVECPWCDGSGHWIPGHDAQARRREGGEKSPQHAA